ncbi:MAG: hypothetical protein AAGF79_11110, partial [Pseudomonadota bacterium]
IAETIAVTDFSRVGKRGVHLAVWPLDHGFEAPGLTVISEQDVLGDRLIRDSPRRRSMARARSTDWCTQWMHCGRTVR